MSGDPVLSTLMAGTFEFDVRRGAGDESPRLASGLPVHAVAGDLTGGFFYLCGNPAESAPVLYASSEGGAGVIAADLAAALTMVVGFPYWRDVLTYSAGGDLESMQTAGAFLWKDMLANRPEMRGEQLRAAEALGLTLPSPPVLVAGLHAAVRSAGPDFSFADATGEYGGLFGPFPPSRNPLWRPSGRTEQRDPWEGRS